VARPQGGWGSELPDPLPEQSESHPVLSGHPARHVRPRFDISEPIPSDVKWPAPAAVPATGDAALAGLTLDLKPEAGEARLLGNWEQPSGASMAEPPSERAQRHGRAAQAGYRPTPPPGVAARAAALPAVTPGAAQRPLPAVPARALVEDIDTRSFWETLGHALLLPFSGHGLYWIAAVSVWSIAVGELGLVAQFVPLIGAAVMFLAQTSVIGFACDFARACFWVAPVGDTEVGRLPELDPVRILDVYIRSGLHLSFFILLSQAALMWWIVAQLVDGAGLELLTDPITWEFALLPGLYWPMGVGLTATSNNFAAIWNVPAGARAILRAPLEYAVIVLIGGAAFCGTALAIALFGAVFGLAGSLLPPAIGFPVVVSHGIMGSLFGNLARARPEVFEA
jgi:hypothetical protein